jgi:hypothetical protein
MQDRPTVLELLDAVRGFIEKDAVDALEGTAKFHARVAANVLAIVIRELELEPAQLAAEWQRLDQLLGAEAAPVAAEGVSDADAGEFRAAVLAHVRATVIEKLAIANPKLRAPGTAAGRTP